MTQKRLLFLQAIASFSIGGSLLCFVVLFFYFFPNLVSLYGKASSGPWIEEILKFGGVLFLINIAYITPLTIPFIGVGFGFMEGIYHIMVYERVSILAFWVHIILGLIMTYFFYLAKKQKHSNLRSVLYALALLIPAYLHILYNITVAN